MHSSDMKEFILAHLAVRAAKVDVGQVFWKSSVVEEHARLDDFLRQDAGHSQHGPPPILQLCLSVPAFSQLLLSASLVPICDAVCRS